jgi:hypothetical protein
VEDDAVLVLGIRGCARYAQAHVPERGSYHRVPRVPLGLEAKNNNREKKKVFVCV